MTSLTQIDIEDFWIRCYLNPKENFIDAAIARAYRDFNRTLHGIGKEQTEVNHSGLKKEMVKIVSELLIKNFNNQDDFDKWHEIKCKELVKVYKDILNHQFFIGQSQKWINMTFKYLFALGETRVFGISKNYRYFHFPVDNIIQNKFFKEEGIPKFKIAWSRIDNYSDYLNYQLRIRERFTGQIPLDVEFRLFNK